MNICSLSYYYVQNVDEPLKYLASLLELNHLDVVIKIFKLIKNSANKKQLLKKSIKECINALRTKKGFYYFP